LLEKTEKLIKEKQEADLAYEKQREEYERLRAEVAAKASQNSADVEAANAANKAAERERSKLEAKQ
jgi:hypothetical protein